MYHSSCHHTHLAMSLPIRPLALIARSRQTYELPFSVETPGPVATGVHAVAGAVVLIPEGTATRHPDQIPELFPAFPTSIHIQYSVGYNGSIVRSKIISHPNKYKNMGFIDNLTAIAQQ